MAAPEPVPGARAPGPLRTLLTGTNLIALLLAFATIAGLTWWVLDRLAHVQVADARIAATMVAVSARVDGWITAVPVEEGQHVAAGDLLFALDDEHAQLLRDELAARVRILEAERAEIGDRRAMVDAQTASRLAAQQSRLTAARAAHDALAADLERVAADWARATPLLEGAIISRQEWERMRSEHQQARSRLQAAAAEVEAEHEALAELEAGRTELAVLDATAAGLEQRIEESRAQLAQQQLAVRDHEVRSPIDGVIDQLFVDGGEYVARGQRSLVMHDPRALWVSANVKETEVRHLAPGKPARVRIDAWPDRDFSGRLTRIGDAVTSQFALLPNPNPSGNFTKITQRIEVRIDLDPTDVALRPGMMVEVEFAR